MNPLSNALARSVNLLPGPARGWIRRIPLLAGIQRLVVRRGLHGRTFIHRINAGPARGLTMAITLPQQKAFWSGTFEPEFTGAIAQSTGAGDICYDVGGHCGYVAGVMALAGARQVFIFEPLPDNLRALADLATLNPGLSFSIQARALSDRDGGAQFKVMGDRSMGKLQDSAFQPDAPAAAVLRVSVRRLDSLVFHDNLPPPRLLKIDVEGAEAAVLAGARRTLQVYGPRVFLEAHSPELSRTCAGMLKALGYVVRLLDEHSPQGARTRHLIAEPCGLASKDGQRN